MVVVYLEYTTYHDTITQIYSFPLKYDSLQFQACEGTYLYLQNIKSLKLKPIFLIDSVTNDTLKFNILPENVILEANMLIKSLIPCNLQPSDYQLNASLINTNKLIKIVWQPQTCANFYELEWVYIDDYHGNSYFSSQNLKYYFPYKIS